MRARGRTSSASRKKDVSRQPSNVGNAREFRQHPSRGRVAAGDGERRRAARAGSRTTRGSSSRRVNRAAARQRMRGSSGARARSFQDVRDCTRPRRVLSFSRARARAREKCHLAERRRFLSRVRRVSMFRAPKKKRSPPRAPPRSFRTRSRDTRTKRSALFAMRQVFRLPVHASLRLRLAPGKLSASDSSSSSSGTYSGAASFVAAGSENSSHRQYR